MFVPRTTAEGFPLAPSQDEWDAMTERERDAVVAALPGEVTDAEMSPPEGDRHLYAKVRALTTLRGYFARQKRRIYLAGELPTYYPAEPRFAPDLVAVLDVEDRERDSFIVSREGKGLDWVLEVHVGGDRKKDAERNVGRYARLGITEYFLYDRARGHVAAYRLATPMARTYTPILPQRGLFFSEVLGLDVQVESDRLRFFAGTAMLLESDELVHRLEGMVETLQQKADEAVRLREEESRLREEAESEVARLRRELEALSKKE